MENNAIIYVRLVGIKGLDTLDVCLYVYVSDYLCDIGSQQGFTIAITVHGRIFQLADRPVK